MSRFFSQFTGKKFKYGAFSGLMTLVVIAILVLINLVAGQLNAPVDMTAEKMYSISARSKEIVRELTEDVTIYTLYKTGTESDGVNFMYSQILQQYAEASPRIKIMNRDPYLYPQFVESFAKDGEQIPANSLIVSGKARSRIIPDSDLVTTEFDYYTFSTKLVSFNIEPQVTNAINYVTQEHICVVYVMEGHSEVLFPDSLNTQLTLAGYELRTVDLTKENMPGDCEIFLATQPQTDWTQNEAEKITAYLQNNGRAMFIIGYSSQALENVGKVLNPYGIRPGKHLVIEGDAGNYAVIDGRANPLALIPNYTGAEAISTLASGPNQMIMYMSAAVGRTDGPVGSTVSIEPLLTTSGQAYEKTNMDTTTLEMEPGDNPGPFNLAVSVTDRFYSGSTDYTTKFVYCSSLSLLDESLNSFCRNANWDFIGQSMSWLRGQTGGAGVYIAPKSATTSVGVLYGMKQSDANFTVGVCAVAIPLAVAVTGLIWWLRRRYS